MRRNFFKSLVAVVIGNILYFFAMPILPPAARHQPMRVDVGTLVDAWFCLTIYGLVSLFSRSAAGPRKQS
ncbi:MAG TPA: hypothetical protein VFZ99_08375 [Terriglobales bacterium]